MIERKDLNKCRRIVIKVGTSTLTYKNGQLNLKRIDKLVRQMADLHNQDKEVLLVSSGAIGVGASRMGLKKVPLTMPEKQALAAIGQGALLHIYEKIFAEYGKTVAQVLLTRGDFDERIRYLNATNALLAILHMGVIPIINENDTVVVEEIRFGDNDTLSALVAGVVDADLLIILSDVDGLYDRDPRRDKDALLLSEVYEITEEIEENSKSKGSRFSSGGMYTKLKAARMCMAAGIPMLIANSEEDNVITRLMEGEKLGTLFVPREEKMQARKKWIAFGRLPQGEIVVDDGAKEALLAKGKSLLPSGVVEVRGDFQPGEVVKVLTLEGREIARGLTNYGAEEIRLIAGKNTRSIEKILGYKDYDEVIHRNNLWVEC
ncbi:glutamate 5-kinase [Thermosyntropha lipolytica DSM 11003]|uniref:Glutamate 5-kinase n=1 Tax=Thermosyntropha lipolytica DSM 11003 TaxID=1123382 RepID=A0A1M5R285_9FIRM|nr:glutamate 5-kinase [Thermosyntropha lipolytica]SHH20545.1 glutamate 5-kinase [Thermosyntropha lipolytica DSM 11003]